MTIDELTTMDGNKCILQLRGLRPFLSPKYNLKKHPNFKYTAEADKNNAFDVAGFINTKLKTSPNDIFTVYHADIPDESSTDDADANGDIDNDILNFDDLDDPDAFA